LSNLAKASDNFRTPKRLKLGSMLSPENLPVLVNARGSPLADVFPLSTDENDEIQSQKVESALRKIFANWNKIETKFHQLVHLELDTTARSTMKYRNTVTDVICDVQEAMEETNNRVQILQASLGDQVDDPEAGPLSIWEAIKKLRSELGRTSGMSEGNFLRLNELRKKIPNWGTTLENLTASYIDTIPKINRNLVTMRGQIAALKGGILLSHPTHSVVLGLGSASGFHQVTALLASTTSS
jgi:hypothetical protein